MHRTAAVERTQKRLRRKIPSGLSEVEHMIKKKEEENICQDHMLYVIWIEKTCVFITATVLNVYYPHICVWLCVCVVCIWKFLAIFSQAHQVHFIIKQSNLKCRERCEYNVFLYCFVYYNIELHTLVDVVVGKVISTVYSLVSSPREDSGERERERDTQFGMQIFWTHVQMFGNRKRYSVELGISLFNNYRDPNSWCRGLGSSCRLLVKPSIHLVKVCATEIYGEFGFLRSTLPPNDRHLLQWSSTRNRT